jgi:modulator of FtsH protease HflC
MRRSLSGAAIAIIALVAIILVWMSTFVVDPTEQALVLRFGQPVRDLIGAPGLYFKMPFIDTAVYIDKRILALDDERQEVLVSDNQRLEVDAFVRYHIADPLLFYQSVFDTRGADAQLGGMLNSALRRSLSGASITDIVRDKRDALMADIRDQMIVGAKRFGLEVIDVRIKRADLPAENSEAVFRRMQTERQQRAASYRAQGSQQSQQIRPRRTARSPSSPPRLSNSPSRFAAKATASATAFSPRPTAPIRNSSPSTDPCKPIRTASTTARPGR